MAINPKYVINAVDNTGTLDLYNNGVFVTRYSFSDNNVQLAERVNTDVLTVAQLRENTISISDWIVLIMKYLSVTNTELSLFTEENKKKIHKFESSYKIGMSNVTEVEYVNSTKLSSFAPRSEMTMSFSDFKNWADFIRRFYIYAASF